MDIDFNREEPASKQETGTDTPKKQRFIDKIKHINPKNIKNIRASLKNSLYFTKKSLIAAGIITILLLSAVIFYHKLFFAERSGALLFAAAVTGSLIVGLLTAIHVRVSNKTAKIVNPIIYFLIPVISMCMAECLNGKFIYDFSVVSFCCNYIVYLLLYSIIMIISGSYKMPILVMTPMIFIFALICSIVLTFRGTPVVPMDVLTISTGLGVASSYSYTVPYTLILGIILFLIIMMTGIRMTRVRFTRKGSIACRCLALFFILGVTIPFYTTDIAANHGIKPDFWNQTRGYHKSGTMLNFFLNTKYLIIETPADYNSSQITAIVEDFLKENEDDPGILATSRKLQKEEAERLAEEQAEAEREAADKDGEGIAAENNTEGAGENGVNAEEGIVAVGNPAADAAAEKTDTTQDGIPLPALSDDGLMTSLDENGNPIPNTGLDTELAVKSTSDKNQPAASARKKKNQVPNVICIMNETFSDLRILGDFSTNKDYMPFTRNLTKNTIKGNLYMPVNGAGTSNSEFEFLTGNTMAFLAAGSNAYELYIKNKLPSLPHTLEAQGFSRSALHVYYGSSWQRDVNYPLLGFERFDSIESFIDNAAIDEYRNGNKSFLDFEAAVNAQYPDENVLLRNFVSDEFDYKLLKQMYEERDPSKPFHVFNVTMQNHGSYNTAYTNFNQQIRLTSTDKYYPAANRYLSLMYESDQAFQHLVEYFSKVKEPTIICMFGDHHPNVETTFVESLLGDKISNLNLEQRQKRFATPFIIWANYDIEESYVDKISSNYLSTLLLQTAGLKTTKYNDYLSALYRYLPVIDTTGYITADGRYYTYDQKSEYDELLTDYEKVQYNNLFDNIGRHDELFYLPDETASQ